MKIKYLIICLPFILLLNCKSEENKIVETLETEKSNEKTLEEYSEEELLIYSNEIKQNLSDTNKSSEYKENAIKLLSVCQTFIAKFPESKSFRKIARRGSGAAQGLGNFEETIRIIDISIEKFPNDSTIVEEMINKATIYDNLEDKKNARLAYQAIIDKFPNHVYGKSSMERLETLDLSQEELLKLLTEKNAK